MRLTLTEREIAFRDELRAFHREHVDPAWRQRHRTLDELCAYQRTWDGVLYAGGWAAPAWPTEYGGRGANAVERAIFADETARAGAPEGLARHGKRLVAPVLMRFGTPEQRAHIEPILRGDEVWCQGFSEPDAGSDLPGLRTRARRDGDTWVVTGRKIWTSYAQYAHWVFLLVRTGPLESRERGISILLVDLRSPGIQIHPIRTLSGHSEFNEVTYDEVRVPAANLVGEVDEGWRIVRAVLQEERGADFCLSRFIDIRRTFTDVVEHARTRPPGAEAHRGTLGELYARLFGVPLLAADLLSREQDGTVPPGLVSVLKLYTTETWRRVGDEQVGRWGAALFDGGGDQLVHDYFESRHYTISAGTSEIQRNAIAGRLLRLPSSGRKGRAE